MKADYICEVTADISFGGLFYSISTACPVYCGKQVSIWDGEKSTKVDFVDGVSAKLLRKLRYYLPKDSFLEVSAKKSPYAEITSDCVVDDLCRDIVVSLLNTLFYELKSSNEA